MGLRLVHELTPPLEEILGDDEEGRFDYQRISRCVVAYLFSRYPERSQYALIQLNKIIPAKGGVSIVSFHSNRIISAYLRFAITPEKLMFVANYSSPQRLEEVPDEEERKLWAEAGLIH